MNSELRKRYLGAALSHRDYLLVIQHSYGKPLCLMGKLTTNGDFQSMVFNFRVTLQETKACTACTLIHSGFAVNFPFNLVPECSGFREYPWWVLARKPNISIWNWIQRISMVGSRKQSLIFPSGFDITWHCLLSLPDLSPISPQAAKIAVRLACAS